MELQRRASLVWEEYREDLLAHSEAIDIPLAQFRKRRVRIAHIAGERIGFSAVLPRGTDFCELDGLFVEPAFWRRGVGRALIEDARRIALRHVTRAMEVTANPRAKAFYLKLGFVACGVVQTQFGPATRLACTLDGTAG